MARQPNEDAKNTSIKATSVNQIRSSVAASLNEQGFEPVDIRRGVAWPIDETLFTKFGGYILPNNTLLDGLGFRPRPGAPRYELSAANLGYLGTVEPDKERFNFVYRLLFEMFPLWTLKELENETAAFVEYLQHNREHLIQTGFPKTSFTKNAWLAQNLTTLNFTKIPLFVRNVRSTSDEDTQFEYIWPIEEGTKFDPVPSTSSLLEGAGIGFWYTPDGAAYTLKIESVNRASYDQAALIDGISCEMASRAERAREVLFDLRIRILDHVLLSMYRKSADGLLNQCINTASSVLNAEQGLSSIELCHLYIKSFEPSITSNMLPLTGEALFDILLAVGLYEEEITYGTQECIRKTLGDLVKLDQPGHRYVNLPCTYSSLGSSQKVVVDNAYNLLSRLQAPRSQFWENHMRRVFELPREFKAKLHDGKYLKLKHVECYISKMKQYSDFLCKHFNDYDSPPFMQQTVPAVTSDTTAVSTTTETTHSGLTEGRILSKALIKSTADSTPGFRHSPDFRSVWLRGEQYVLSSYQAQVIEELTKAYLNGTPDISQTYLTVTVLGINTNRVRDVFKKDMEAYKALICQGGSKGTLKLNI